MYQAGLHLIATLTTSQAESLSDYSGVRSLLDNLVLGNGLVKLGEVYHAFEGAGFTAVVCLSESHLSIHTWPEYGKVNLDIYLSNYLRNNDGTVTAIFDELVTYFGGSVTDLHKIQR